MVKRRYYKQFLESCITKAREQEICIWGGRSTGRDLAETLLDNQMVGMDHIHIMDIALAGRNIEINGCCIQIEHPKIYLKEKERYFIICAVASGDTAFIMHQSLFGKSDLRNPGEIYEGYANIWYYIENLIKSSPELIREVKEESDNLLAFLYSHQSWSDNMMVDGQYQHTATITTKVGCPIHCKYCPQDVFLKAYKKCKNPIMELSFKDYLIMLSKIPKTVIISFTGFVEPFSNPLCLDMIMYTLKQGYFVRVYSTLYNLSIEDYNKFKDHENLVAFSVHLPDSNGNTQFDLTKEYKKTLQYVVSHPPQFGKLYTSCLGINKNTREEIRDIISLPGDPIMSIHGLVYDNRLTHHGKIICNKDCTRLSDMKSGIGAILPNGDVYGCGLDWELRHSIGNILEVENWNDIMQGELRKKFRDSLNDPSEEKICTHCESATGITY